jgi:acid phosphatase (class A)
MRRTLTFRSMAVIGLAALLSACAGLAPSTPLVWSSFADRPSGYLAKGEGPIAADYLAPPPAPDSARGKADTDAFLATRALAGTPRWTLAVRDAELFTPQAALTTFACALGADLKPTDAPHLTRLLGRIPADVDATQETAKAGFARDRPFLQNPGTEICLKREPWMTTSKSYPSGHAGAGWAWALVLTQLAPDRAAQLIARGRAMGDSRVVCGVHFLSDVEAGRQTGAALAAYLQSKPEFRADLKAAGDELAAARKTAPHPNCDLEHAALGTP